MSLAKIYLPALFLFWAGLLFGVSFVATPVKFQAPSLSLGAAVDVGRYTFAWLNRLEIGLALVAVLMLWRGTRSALVRSGTAAVVAWVSAKALWALPLLDERAQAVIDGGSAPPSAIHQIYVVADLIELIVLLALGFATLYAHGTPPRPQVRYR